MVADDGPHGQAAGRCIPWRRPSGHGAVTYAGGTFPLGDGAADHDERRRRRPNWGSAWIVSTERQRAVPRIMGSGRSLRAGARAGWRSRTSTWVASMKGVRGAGHPSADKEVDIDDVNGGAIAVGHPFGMTGNGIATLLNGGSTTRRILTGDHVRRRRPRPWRWSSNASTDATWAPQSPRVLAPRRTGHYGKVAIGSCQGPFR